MNLTWKHKPFLNISTFLTPNCDSHMFIIKSCFFAYLWSSMFTHFKHESPWIWKAFIVCVCVKGMELGADIFKDFHPTHITRAQHVWCTCSDDMLYFMWSLFDVCILMCTCMMLCIMNILPKLCFMFYFFYTHLNGFIWYK